MQRVRLSVLLLAVALYMFLPAPVAATHRPRSGVAVTPSGTGARNRL